MPFFCFKKPKHDPESIFPSAGYRASIKSSRRSSLIPRLSTSSAVQQKSQYEKYIAIQSYESSDSFTLSFQQNDIILITNKSLGTWWAGFLISTQQHGYFPSTFLHKPEASMLYAQDYYFGKTGRQEAERQLFLSTGEDCGDGTFLVRESQTDSKAYVLSVLISTSQELIAKHYKINQDPEYGEFYIAIGESFHSIVNLVDFYKQVEDTIPGFSKLKKACVPIFEESRGMGVWEIEKSTIDVNENEKLGKFYFLG